MRTAMDPGRLIGAPATRERGNARSLVALLALASACVPVAHAAGPDGDPTHGQGVYLRCVSCHALTGAQIAGPSLKGVVGRKAGASPGARYSPALAASGIIWQPATLDAFLAAPSQVVPGTTMPVAVPEAQDRADVIAYLKTLKPGKP